MLLNLQYKEQLLCFTVFTVSYTTGMKNRVKEVLLCTDVPLFGVSISFKIHAYRILRTEHALYN